MTEKFEELMKDLPLKEDIDALRERGEITWDEYRLLFKADLKARPNRRSALSQDIEFTLVDE